MSTVDCVSLWHWPGLCVPTLHRIGPTRICQTGVSDTNLLGPIGKRLVISVDVPTMIQKTRSWIVRELILHKWLFLRVYGPTWPGTFWLPSYTPISTVSTSPFSTSFPESSPVDRNVSPRRGGFRDLLTLKSVVGEVGWARGSGTGFPDCGRSVRVEP